MKGFAKTSAAGSPTTSSITTPLFQHQIKSVKFFENVPQGLDLSDPGTGKTRVQIELFRARRRRGGLCMLVLAPKTLLETAWKDDFKRFAPDMTVSVAYASNRESAFGSPADVYVTNSDAVKYLAKQNTAFFKKFDTLVVDEISAFKHATSQRSRALKKIAKLFRYRYGLTGTPNSNTILDIWHPVGVIDGGQRLGTSFYHFRSSVCIPIQVGPQPNMLKWEDRPGSETAVASLISDITMRHKFEECLDIPPNHEYTQTHYLPKPQMRTYLEMEEDAITLLKDGKQISALNAAVVVSKLLQIASGAVYAADSTYSLIDTSRYELVADLIEARKHSLVFFNWTHQRDELKKILDQRGITYAVIDGSTPVRARHDHIDRFQNGLYRVVLAHPQSAAHGITLTRATSTIWCSPTYNLEHYLQGNRRIYRAGQTQKTETLMVLADGTIEGKVYARLKEKNINQAGLLNIVKEMCGGA